MHDFVADEHIKSLRFSEQSTENLAFGNHSKAEQQEQNPLTMESIVVTKTVEVNSQVNT
jgi:hypothetical protein